VVRDELLDAHPRLAADIFGVFSKAKKMYVDRLRNGEIEKPTEVDEMHRRVMEITGRDPLPYGIAPNRQMLEDLIQSAFEQKILSRRFGVEELFARGTLDISG
jgi:4,5-dihydroxyphthalate decarboxylase